MITINDIQFEGPSPIEDKIAMKATLKLSVVVFASGDLAGLPETESHLKQMVWESLKRDLYENTRSLHRT